MSHIHQHNRRAWDERARKQQTFTHPAKDEEFRHPLDFLDSRGWLGGDVRGKRVLCLAAGGGKAGPLFAAAGAEVTVVDISGAMLALDRQVAAERGLSLRVVETSMDDLSMFPDGSFDVVSQPVSTCYVPDIELVYQQVARVIASGGLYVSQHKQPASLQAAEKPSDRGYELQQTYYHEGPLPQVAGTRYREAGTLEFLHRLEQMLGGLCRAGFVIEDLTEPLHADAEAESGSFNHRSQYMPPYMRIKARRTDQAVGSQTSAALWTP